MMNRRTFVGALGCLTAASGLGLGLALPRRRRLAIAALEPATARCLQGTPVQLQDEQGGRLEAIVEAVDSRRYPARRGAPGTEQISLLIKPDQPDVTSGVYHLQAAELQLAGLHFTAVGPHNGERRLEAVINRIV